MGEGRWTQDTPLKSGLQAPEQCARGRTDCRSLSQFVSSGGDTFVCVGEIEPGGREGGDPRDKWSFCLRGCQDRPGIRGTDVRFFVDEMDLSHMAAASSTGLAMAMLRHPDGEPCLLQHLFEPRPTPSKDKADG